MKDGQILKELKNGVVPIEFGSEYTIRLRNRHNRRAVCRLSIDGENISGEGFVIGANSFVDIERPVDVDRKFKFVSLESEEAYDHGKNGPNYNKIKGVISADFALEKEYQFQPNYVPIVQQKPFRPDPYQYPYWYNSNSPMRGVQNFGSVTDGYSYSAVNNLTGGDIKPNTVSLNAEHNLPKASLMDFVDSSVNLTSTNVLQDGATVEGSKSFQKFSSVYFDSEDNWTNIKVFLQGYTPEPKLLRATKTTSSCISINDLAKEIKEINEDSEVKQLEQELAKLKYKEELKKQIAELQAKLEVV